MDLLRRYSKLDTFQKSGSILRNLLVKGDNGSFHVSTPRDQTDLPQPFKLSQRLKSDVVAQIIDRYEAGEPSTVIATTFNISKGSVIRLLREAGIPIRNQSLADNQIAKAVQLYKSGQSLAQIGAHLGVDHGTVWRQLKKNGVKMRDTHGRPK